MPGNLSEWKLSNSNMWELSSPYWALLTSVVSSGDLVDPALRNCCWLSTSGANTPAGQPSSQSFPARVLFRLFYTKCNVLGTKLSQVPDWNHHWRSHVVSCSQPNHGKHRWAAEMITPDPFLIERCVAFASTVRVAPKHPIDVLPVCGPSCGWDQWLWLTMPALRFTRYGTYLAPL